MNQTSQPKNYRSLMQAALLKIRQLRAQLQSVEDSQTETIAIIGIGCRFPGGVDSPESFWQLLQNGVDAITEVPSDRWDLAQYFDPDPEIPGKIYSRCGGFIGALQTFDASFFGISRREAVSLDPQQRLLLEVTWEALEHAGIVPEADSKTGHKTGVFVGMSSNDYSQQLLMRDINDIDAYLATGNSHSTAAGRLSYTLGFTGASLAIDTACSSSLVAVHLACQNLRSQDCSVAIVGGVNRIISPEFSINFAKAKMLSVDGRCKTFDARADGFVRAEGCGVVVLKRLSDAVKDGDRILSVIRGSAVNQDGCSSGLTVPNGLAQQSVIWQALQNSQLEPSQIQYIEAHGTGTALGDPIEVNALGEVFAKSHSATQPLLIGSVKTNIGHLEAASGIAGLIKVVMSLQHNEIPAHLHFQQPSPHIPWAELPIQVSSDRTPWRQDIPRRAGVSSFGFSGTNAHVIVEALEGGILEETAEPNAKSTDKIEWDLHVLTLSAKSPEALRDVALRYQQHLSICPSFANFCFSANTGRTHFSHRFSLVSHSSSEAIEKLTAFLAQPISEDALEIPSLQPSTSERQTLLSTLTQRYQQGMTVDWRGFYQDCDHQKIDIPTYPFQRQRHWFISSPTYSIFHHSSYPLLGRKLQLARSQLIHFESQIAQDKPAFLEDHRVLGKIILPMAGYIEMALAAGHQTWQNAQLVVENLRIHQAIALSKSYKIIQFVLNPEADHQFEIFAQNSKDWTLQATGKVKVLETADTPIIDQEKLKADCDRPLDLTAYYERFREHGIDYGDTFKALISLWQGNSQALGQIQFPASLSKSQSDLPIESYQLHPVLLDGAFQVIGAAFNPDATVTYLPIGLERLTFYQSPGEQIWCHAQLRSSFYSQQAIADLTLFSSDGSLIAIVEGLQIQKTSREPLLPSFQNWLYQIEWQPQSLKTPLDYPAPTAIRDRFLPQFTANLTQPDLVAYQALLSQLELLSLSYILAALTALGWQPVLHQQFSTSQLAQQLQIIEVHHILLHRLLEILSQEGILHRQADQWQVLQIPSSSELSTQYPTIQVQDAIASVELTLLDRCGSQLAAVLQGKIDPIEVLFPAGDLTTLTQLYQDSPGAALMNRSIQEILSLILEHKPHARQVRLLEIGAGTGGTTAHLLPHLTSVDYVFTDVSPMFLHKAQQRFKAYSFIQYQTLDIERSLDAQNFSLHQYDIIIAANVVHATKDLQQSFQHIHQLLAPGGILILLEGVRPMRWLDLIFGLTEGWWRFQDRQLRPSYPLLPAQQWQQVLQSSGFDSAIAVSPDEQSAPQTVFVAHAGRKLLDTQYVIFCDRQGIGSCLAQHLKAKGYSTVEVFSGQSYQQQSPHEFTLNPTSFSDIQELLKALNLEISPHIIHLWSLDTPSAEQNSNLMDAMQPNCVSVLNLVQTQIKMTLWLVTQGAIAVQEETLPGITQTPVWGLGNVIALEHPELHCKRIDLDSNLPLETQAILLFAETQSITTDDQITLRNKERFIPHLKRYSNHLPHELSLPENQPFQLVSTASGTLENLILQPNQRRSPQPHEIEIRVWATGLNLIDVLDALGLLPFKRDGFGVECAGEIVAIGNAIQNFQVGNAVVALASHSFSQYVTTHQAMVAALPKNLDFEAAATIPANFLTADYALHRIAQLSAGETVLIHAAAGGTGMAAVQIAQQVGAEVFATASPAKWQALRAMGVQHLFNSRTLDFAEQIMSLTKGKGVNVVFNSLSGEFIPKGLSVLSENGRFLEIGKRDVWTAAQVQQLYPSVRYHLIDVMSLAQQQPDLIQEMLQSLMAKFEKGELQPLPRSRFSIQQAISAFRYMQQAKHIGKVVLSQIPKPVTKVHSNSTYLITGGLGGLGLRVAAWLGQKGATHIVLLSRHAPNEVAQQTIQSLEQAGLKIILFQVDVSDRSQLAHCFTQIEQLPPLRGVFHAAGVLDDGLLQQLNWQRLKTVMAPKIAGAWNLHILTQNKDLDWFVLFSSAASLLGSPGQANHVAANLFLDALAHHRQAIALPALSINWGAWSEVGSAVDRAEQMRSRGVESIAPEQGVQILEQLLQQSAPQVGVIPIDWVLFRQRSLSQSNANSQFFEHFQSETPTSQPTQLPILQELRNADDRLAQLTTYLQIEVGKVLGLPATQRPKPQQGFFDLGMDSLMTVELKNRLESSLAITLPATVIFEYPTIHNLAQHILNDHLKLEAFIHPESPPDLNIEDIPAELVESSVLAELLELETLLSRN